MGLIVLKGFGLRDNDPRSFQEKLAKQLLFDAAVAVAVL
jgi:hypothetical protein